MLHARHHLLADIAALLEIDPVELVHVGLVREGVAVGEIESARRHAERDPVRLVGGGIDQFGPDRGRRGLRGRWQRCSAAPIAAAAGPDSTSVPAAAPSQIAITPRSSDRFSTVTLARSL